MTTQLYLDHFGFATRPFSILPDAGMLFWSPAHRKAFSVLEYGLMTRAPLTVVTGEVGTGKTTLVRALLDRVDGGMRVALISNAQGGRGDLLRWVLNALDVSYPEQADYVRLFQIFQDFVVAEYAAGRLVVLIFDEAQNLGAETLEELRMLTNVNSGADELLQLILLGHPELRDIITRPELRQFAQRVAATFHLSALDAPTTAEYIRHRLRCAGGTGSEFDAAALDAVYRQSGGIPRIINMICDLALVYASSDGKRVVGGDIIAELVSDGLLLAATDGPAATTAAPPQDAGAGASVTPLQLGPQGSYRRDGT